MKQVIKATERTEVLSDFFALVFTDGTYLRDFETLETNGKVLSQEDLL